MESPNEPDAAFPISAVVAAPLSFLRPACATMCRRGLHQRSRYRSLMADVFHLGLSRGDIEGATTAIVPGDPARVGKIGVLLDDARPLAAVREFTSWLGYLDGRPTVVCSTGIGGPSTSIALEELAQLGVSTFLRVGTTGAIQPNIEVGEIIVAILIANWVFVTGHFLSPARCARWNAFAGMARNEQKCFTKQMLRSLSSETTTGATSEAAKPQKLTFGLRFSHTLQHTFIRSRCIIQLNASSCIVPFPFG